MIPPALGAIFTSRASVPTRRKDKKDMNTQTNKEAGPAASAVTDGRINIPQPKTAPIVNAVP
ncbi:hypothetical protein STZ1_50161 [Bacillus subtilis]